MGENIILFFLKLISKKLSRKKGKINTIQHGQGENIDTGGKNTVFSPSSPPVKVEQLIAGPRREKIKIQGVKIKTQGKKISYIFPQLNYSDTVTKKDCVQRKKYDLISLLSL
jgi:hypothetical protein